MLIKPKPENNIKILLPFAPRQHICFNFRTRSVTPKVQMWEERQSSSWRVFPFSALWNAKGAEEVVSPAADTSEGDLLESWCLEQSGTAQHTDECSTLSSVARTDKDPSAARGASGPGAPQASLALTHPTHPGAPISAQPGLCQVTEPAEPDPLHEPAARRAWGPTAQLARSCSTLARLRDLHFYMSLVSNGGTDLFLPDLIFFSYKAQTIRPGCLVACSGWILLERLLRYSVADNTKTG